MKVDVLVGAREDGVAAQLVDRAQISRVTGVAHGLALRLTCCVFRVGQAVVSPVLVDANLIVLAHFVPVTALTTDPLMFLLSWSFT